MVRIYGDCLSGNCYKLKLVLELLGTPHVWKFTTWTDGSTRTDAFRAINPAGKVPVLETSKGEMIPESGAALYYLARDSHLWPQREVDRAQARPPVELVGERDELGVAPQVPGVVA